MKNLFFSLALLGILSAGALAQFPKDEPKLSKATYLITGLHCPPCTKTVEGALRKVPGVRSAKVDWRTKAALIEFDEAKLPAQGVSQAIASTHHMMGGDLEYAGWLTLKSKDLREKDLSERAKEALEKVEGVKQVKVYPNQESLAVLFTAKGKVTSEELRDALKAAGIDAPAL